MSSRRVSGLTLALLAAIAVARELQRGADALPRGDAPGAAQAFGEACRLFD